MAMPKSLVGEANAHVSQALQTGARGQTTTHTDYGVIGDAFFKKAQLDLNIADLKADMGYKAASLKSGLEMQKADLVMKGGQLKMNAMQLEEEQRRYEESQEASSSETLLGSISGAVSGAVTGFAVGGVPGAVIGAGAGGLMTYAGYQQGGRPGGQQAQSTLGNIANMSTTLKGAMDAKVAKDSWAGIAKAGSDIIANFNAAGSDPEARLAAQQQLQAHGAEVFNAAMTMPGANPEKAGALTANYMKGLQSAVGFDSTSARGQREMAQLENLVKFRADPRATSGDPSAQREWAMDFLEADNAIYEDMTGKAMPIGIMLDRARKLSPDAGQMVEQELSGRPSATGISDMSQSSVSTSRTAPSAGRSSQAEAPQDMSSAPSSVRSERGGRPDYIAPETGRMVGTGGGIPFAPQYKPGGHGISMDDGGSFQPVQAEKELSRMGAETVEALTPEEEKVRKPGLLERVLDHPLVSTEGSFPDRIADKLRDKRMAKPEYKSGSEKITASINKEANKYWQEKIDEEGGGEINQVLYSSTNPKEIADALGTKEKVATTKAERDELAGMESGLANMNQLKSKAVDLNAKLHKFAPDSTHEERVELVRTAIIAKEGEGGPGKDQAMRSRGGGFSLPGLGGVQMNKFDSNFSMQIEKMGIRPDSKEARELYNAIIEVDAIAGPLAMQQAKMVQGGSQISDAERSIFQTTNLVDREPTFVISAIHQQQRMMINNIESKLDRWETQGERDNRIKYEAELKRAPAKPKEIKQPKSAFEFLYRK